MGGWKGLHLLRTRLGLLVDAGSKTPDAVVEDTLDALPLAVAALLDLRTYGVSV